MPENAGTFFFHTVENYKSFVIVRVIIFLSKFDLFHFPDRRTHKHVISDAPAEISFFLGFHFDQEKQARELIV